MNEPSLKEFKNLEEFATGFNFKYAIGSFLNYEEAKNYHNNIKSKFPDSFIIAIKNKQIIPLSDAIKN